MTEREIFFEALEKDTPEARAAYLQGTCGQDVSLRRKVDELLKEHFSNDSLLAGSALDTARPELAEFPVEEAPAEMFGRYKLLEKIGEGGFGEVWMAEQREPVKRRVALKIIKPGMDSRQIVARFEAERQALAMMDHPNIAKIFDAGTTGDPHPIPRPRDHPLPSDGRGVGGEGVRRAGEGEAGLATRPPPPATHYGRPYFVMELVRGVRITEYCDQNQLPTRERLKLFILVCQAIQHAHQKGIIHRDIKPSNILVTLHDPAAAGVPKVIDFGIAKATQQELTEKTVFTQFQQFIGTPAYISPEQAEMSPAAAGDIDTRADIYSLGVLLYELLVGVTPFDGKELIASGIDGMRKIIREKEPARPSTRLTQLQACTRESKLVTRHSSLATDLDWIVMKCLEKDRARRYDTATGLAADIQRHIDNEPVVARPPSAAYKFQKAWQRNKLVFTAGAVVAVALVAGIGVSTWQARRADAQARKASNSEQRSRRFLYASEMYLAQQALNLNDLGRARRLLDRYRTPPQSGDEDLRGWEWRYLWQLTRGDALVTLTHRTNRGFSVSFSPDGSRLAVGWWDGRVDLWDVPGRRWVRTLTDHERPHPGRVTFSPVRNLLAATSEPKVVTLYDLDSGRESTLWRAPDQAEWSVRDLSFSQDGSRVVIYAGSNPEGSDAVWVVNVSSSQIESIHPTGYTHPDYVVVGAARISPDNRRLYLARSDYLNERYILKCIDLSTRKELWTESQRDFGLSTLDISPDGQWLAWSSAFADKTIHIWDAATGASHKQLKGHPVWVCDLAFSRDGRRLVSAAGDQTIRVWDTTTWTNEVLLGHTDEVWAIAVSEQLIASASKDGDLMLWRMDGKHAANGYRRLPESLGHNAVQPLNHSRVLLLPAGQLPELVDLKGDSPPMSLPEIGPSTNVLGCFSPNLLCLWNGTNQILVGELRGAKFVQRGAIALDSGMRPTGFAYNPARQLLAWTEGTSSASIYLASLTAPGRRIELKSDIPGLVPFHFSENGNYLTATRERDALRTWNIDAEKIVASVTQTFSDACFAANGRVLVVALRHRIGDQIGFYDLGRPDRLPQLVLGGFFPTVLGVSPDGGLVAAGSADGPIGLFDPSIGQRIGLLHGHRNSAIGLAFSPDGRRLFSSSGGGDAKLWDVETRQELLTLGGNYANIDADAARWSTDGEVIFDGPPWQAWFAPSWEDIAAAEAKDPPSSDFGGQGKAEFKQP